MRPKNILLATDFSKFADSALDEALFWAHQFSAQLHLLHVVVLFGDSPAHDAAELSATYERLSAEASDRLRGSVAERGTQGLTIIEGQRRDFTAAPAILRYARENEVDLIVVGSHGRRGWRRFLLGSVAEEVMRSAECPVLVVHGQEAVEERSLDRILVPFDFSSDAIQSLETAKELASQFGSHIDLVHVMASPITTGGTAIPVPGLPLSSPAYVDLRAQTEELLRSRVEEAETARLHIEPHLLTGHPANTIVDLARKLSTDLILIASHGLSGLQRALLGSVSERVARSAGCSVLVLRRPAEHADD